MSSGRKFMIHMNRVKNNISSIQTKINIGQPLNLKEIDFLEHQYGIYREHHEYDV